MTQESCCNLLRRHYRLARQGQYNKRFPILVAICIILAFENLHPDGFTGFAYTPTYQNTNVGPIITPKPSQKWIESCRKYIPDTHRACLDEHKFWDHYTVMETGADVHVAARNVTCIAAASIFKHQMCDLDCSQGWYFSILNTGSGTGSRWHTYTKALMRALDTNEFIRLWEGAGSFPFFTTDKCVEGSERCYFSRSDPCPTHDGASTKDTQTDISERQVTYSYRKRTVSNSAAAVSLGQSYLWLSSQVMFFLLQPLPFVLQWVDDFWATDSKWRVSTGKVNRYEPYITMHVRWGDKCGWGADDGKEAKCVPFDRYMQAAERLRQVNPNLKHIVLSTEDSRALETLDRYTERWTFSYTQTDRKGADLQSIMRSGNATDFQTREVQNSLINFYLSAYADAAVYTASSNWSRAFLRFSRALRGRIIDSVSMDDWERDEVLENVPSRLLAEIHGRPGPEGQRYCFENREECPSRDVSLS